MNRIMHHGDDANFGTRSCVILLFICLFSLSQALFIAHGFTHPLSDIDQGCEVCLIGASPALADNAAPNLFPMSAFHPLIPNPTGRLASGRHWPGSPRAPPL